VQDGWTDCGGGRGASARNVPNGSAYFIPPRLVTMRPMPITEPATDAIINVRTSTASR
jgi:hypothetical protein